MPQLDFPSLVKALSMITKGPHLEYLRYSGSTIHEFLNGSCRSVGRIWRRAFSEGYIFTRGTGTSALFTLLFQLQHMANEFGVSLEHYLRRVREHFPLADWRSGTGRLSGPKGAGAGKKIADMVLRELIPDLGEGFPDSHASNYLDRTNPGLFNKLKALLSPSGWRPFSREFVNTESGAGVYLIVGLDRELDTVKIRCGQATNLSNRLGSHLSAVQAEFPRGIRPIFYSISKHKRDNLDLAEQALFHLIPRDLRLPTARHPTPCGFCRVLS